MPRRNKNALIAGQSATTGGLAPQHHREYHRYDAEWSEQEAIDAEVSQLVSGGALGALRNPKRWRNSTSSGYSSHSPPLSAGSYSTCCASVHRNSAAGQHHRHHHHQQQHQHQLSNSNTGNTTTTDQSALGLAVIHENDYIPRPIWPCTNHADTQDLHLVGYEVFDCSEGLSTSCSYEQRAYTYTTPRCSSCCCRRNACRDCSRRQSLSTNGPKTAQDVLIELSRTLNSVIDGECGMTPEELLHDITRTVARGIQSNNNDNKNNKNIGDDNSGSGTSSDQIYRLSSSSSSAIGKDSIAVNPVNLKLYGKSGNFFKSRYLLPNDGKTLLEQQSSVLTKNKTDGDDEEKHDQLKRKRDKNHQRVPAVFIVPRCSAIHSPALFNYGLKSVQNIDINECSNSDCSGNKINKNNNNNGNNNNNINSNNNNNHSNNNDNNGDGGGDGRLIECCNKFGDNSKCTMRHDSATTAKSCYTSGEPVYTTQLDPSDESSSYGAVGEPSSSKVNWNESITVFNKSLDFTLDGTRAERLGRIIARAKRRRQWCRALTTILGLVFFVLSVVVVSMSITRGRKIFGSM